MNTIQECYEKINDYSRLCDDPKEIKWAWNELESIILSDRSDLLLDGFLRLIESKIDYYPDFNVGMRDMKEYGYKYKLMLPLQKEKALELFKDDRCIYLLHEDGTESQVNNIDEIKQFNGIYGIEKDDWDEYISVPEIEVDYTDDTEPFVLGFDEEIKYPLSSLEEVTNFLDQIDNRVNKIELFLNEHLHYNTTQIDLVDRIIDFIYDYDFYDALDSNNNYENGRTEVESMLKNPVKVKSLLRSIESTLELGELDAEQLPVAKGIIAELTEIDHNHEKMIEHCKKIISQYIFDEFDEEIDLTDRDISKIDLAYTTTEDGEHEVQAWVDLENKRLVKEVDNEVILEEKFTDYDDLIERISYLEFSELTYVDEEQLESLEKKEDKTLSTQK